MVMSSLVCMARLPLLVATRNATEYDVVHAFDIRARCNVTVLSVSTPGIIGCMVVIEVGDRLAQCMCAIQLHGDMIPSKVKEVGTGDVRQSKRIVEWWAINEAEYIPITVGEEA